MRIKRLIISFIVILIGIPIFSEVTLTDEEYQTILKRLKSDKSIIETNNIIWNNLKKSKPKINYKVIDGQVVIQSVEIPIYKSKPLIYEIKFKVEYEEPPKFFPWTFHLCGMIESTTKAGEKFGVTPDIKLGVQFFSLAGLKIKYLTLGFNALVGIKSLGGSVSYTFPKPLKNTSIHIYAGFAYTIKASYGIGISLNF